MGSNRSSFDMKHNNQVCSVRKFRKYWQRYVKTWFNQPAKKAARRTARDKKAQRISPRPISGAVRPVVHGPTVKYNSKIRAGRGFSLAEIKAAEIGKLEAQSLGIAVDHRRRNRSVEGLQANVQRLREYKANLVVFPRRAKKLKNGWVKDAAADQTSTVQQSLDRITMPHVAAPVEQECRKITAEEKPANVRRSLKAAWNDARLVGFREKRAKERAEKAAYALLLLSAR